LWVDSERRVVRSFPSLSGTFRNCAGGATPWGSWLSAEECTYMPGPPDPMVHDKRPDVSRRHGYIYEVDSRAEGLVDPVPIVAMGRFYHEAVAVDPSTGFVYLTEDRDDGLLYRYRPPW
jgi:secreted PhoX family phosphatase